jgi:hypothetical protein
VTFNPKILETDGNGKYDLSEVEQVKPINLRLAAHPYPHLRDDEGCVLARDRVHLGKIAYLLNSL